MRIAVISDTHDNIPPQLPQMLAAADQIWHLGDVCAPHILEEIEQLGIPLQTILGNNDAHPAWHPTLKLKIAGTRCHLVHIPPTHAPADCDLLLHGHTHIPRDETIGNVRWLNPGAITYPKSGTPSSFAWLTLDEGTQPIWKIVRL